MPSISYRHSPAFRALDGQSPPHPDLLANVFKQTRFDTRFYRLIQTYQPNSSPSPTRFIISAALEPPESDVDDFDRWYREEHLEVLSRAPGFVRSRRFEVEEASTLERFERREGVEVPKIGRAHV